MCFFNLTEWAYLKENDLFSNLKIVICRKYSLQKLTKFSEGTNMLDAAASNRDASPWRDTCVSSTHLKRPFWTKQSIFPPWINDLKAVFLLKTNPILTQKQCARCSCF
jgi:hypothetical protein